MTDMNAVFDALASLKSIVRLHDERLDAQGMLLTSRHPLWREPRAGNRTAFEHYDAMIKELGEAA